LHIKINGMRTGICKGSRSLKFCAFNFTSNVILLSQENLQILFPFYSEKIILIEFILLWSFFIVMKNSQFFYDFKLKKI